MSNEKLCSICKRSSIYDGVEVFPVPKLKSRRLRWFNSCNNLSAHDFVCEFHFGHDDFRMDRKKRITLAPLAVPTINLGKGEHNKKRLYKDEKTLILAERTLSSEFINEEHFDNDFCFPSNLKEAIYVEGSEKKMHLSSKEVQTDANICGLIEVTVDKCYTIKCSYCVEVFSYSNLDQFVAHVEASHRFLLEIADTFNKDDSYSENSLDLHTFKKNCDLKLDSAEISEGMVDVNDMQPSHVEFDVKTSESELIPEALNCFSDEDDNEEPYLQAQLCSSPDMKKEVKVMKSTRNKGIIFGLTPHDIVMDFLELFKAKPILWQYRRNESLQKIKLAKKYITRQLNEKWPENRFAYNAISNSLLRIKTWFRSKLETKTSDHNERHHRRAIYFDKCSEFLTRAMLKESAPTFACNLCESVFVKEKILEQHKYIRHVLGDLPFQCSHCDERFATSKSLRKHKQYKRERLQRAQNKLNPNPAQNAECLVCDVCGKNYVNIKALTRHRHTHEPPRYQCNICQKEYMYLESLKAHLNLHANQRDFFCDVCGKTFVRRSNLRQHLKIHVGKEKRTQENNLNI